MSIPQKKRGLGLEMRSFGDMMAAPTWCCALPVGSFTSLWKLRRRRLHDNAERPRRLTPDRCGARFGKNNPHG